ncbi:NAD(P)/FAD-dependent oxidoreductase [Permianibacter aggregans]|uniref:Gamma-glutamylputrescine oxidase n=1 Tax=Permianibacter aggregans TaxID=1510150 RepID=A0A4R6UG52_9GAMM|nr:FAD-binding oxidoreductase [Permianibacter aggregans]QGX41181.1 FAD-binding oxidoreductase [Permianibacter aggregans]TDQ45781.1 gamma-glutamylputrescine oxidase [Permianibacter aggregans]
MSESLNNIYYRATAGEFSASALDNSIDVDVCIIGGGFAGLATALGLAERGQTNVALLEAEQIGFGASGRNGGFVFGGFSLGGAELIKSVGLQHARELYCGTLEAVETIRQRAKRYQIDCDINDSGVLLANWFDDDKLLREIQSFMADSFEVDWQWVERDKLREQLKTERYFGALWEKNAFHFHPLKYAQGCARALQQMGVQVYENSRVTRIEQTNGRYQIHTASGTVNAKTLVVSCGGYLNNLVPKFARSVMPIATYVMVTEPLGERLQEFVNTGCAIYDTRFAFDYYRPLPDTRLLWGGRISIQDRAPEQVSHLLRKDIAKVYPQLANVRIDYAWSGMMSYARHQMPQIGQAKDGVWYAMGFGGHGVGPTTMAGEVIAKALTGEAKVPWGFSRFGLQSTYGYAGRLAAQATYWWLQAKDWWKQ